MLSTLFSFLSGRRDPALPPDPRLFGTWQSNRELTVETLRASLMFRPVEQQERFFAVFGELQVTYTPTTASAAFPRRPPFTTPDMASDYRVMASGPDSVTLRFAKPVARSPKTQALHFVTPDRYWIDLSKRVRLPLDTTGWREYFDRVPTS